MRWNDESSFKFISIMLLLMLVGVMLAVFNTGCSFIPRIEKLEKERCVDVATKDDIHRIEEGIEGKIVYISDRLDNLSKDLSDLSKDYRSHKHGFFSGRVK